jgi:hypothetical protein
MLARDMRKQNWAYPADLATRIGGRERMVPKSTRTARDGTMAKAVVPKSPPVLTILRIQLRGFRPGAVWGKPFPLNASDVECSTNRGTTQGGVSMMRSRRLLSRASIAGAFVALGVALSGEVLSQPSVAGRDRGVLAAAHTAAGCGTTWIRGVTENRSPIAMHVTQTGHRLGNKWCGEPADEVGSRSSDSWLAGDDSGDTQIHIVYLLENRDKILFQARVSKERPTDVGCSFVDVVRTPREYECQAEVVAGGSGIAFVRFSVVAVRR